MTIDALLARLREQRNQIDAAIIAIESVNNGRFTLAQDIQVSARQMRKTERKWQWSAERRANFVPWNKGKGKPKPKIRKKATWTAARRAKFMATMKKKFGNKEANA